MVCASANGARHDGGQMIAVNGDTIDDQAEMHHDEAEKDRHQHEGRLLHATKIQAGHQHDQR